MNSRDRIPFPPSRLVRRVGCPGSVRRVQAEYDRRGRAMKAAVLDVLPDGWALAGKRVLDFGCGAGRVLRHFLPEADVAEVWGCDVHEPSVRWVEAHLCPPLRVFQSPPAPPLPMADGTFDLIWAVAVFTHLTESWSAWLLDLHRVLVPDGLLVATFVGEGASAATLGAPWQEDQVGMNVLCCGREWDAGGPLALHSSWWVREHWGRAFDVLALQPQGFAGAGQGVALLRKRAVALTPADLERWSPGEEGRELEALRYNRTQLERELAELRATWSWRLTAPVRRLNSSWFVRPWARR